MKPYIRTPRSRDCDDEVDHDDTARALGVDDERRRYVDDAFGFHVGAPWDSRSLSLTRRADGSVEALEWQENGPQRRRAWRELCVALRHHATAGLTSVTLGPTGRFGTPTPIGLAFAHRTWPTLTRVHVTVGQYEFASLDATFWRSVPNLEELCVHQFEGLVALEAVHAPSLRSVRFHREDFKRLSGAIPTGALRAAAWPNLEELALCFGFEQFVGDHLEDLKDLLVPRRVPQLVRLSLHGLDGVGSLVPSILELPALQELDVFGLSDDEVGPLMEHAFHLRRLRRYTLGGLNLSSRSHRRLGILTRTA
jgi:hypothetical protein